MQALRLVHPDTLPANAVRCPPLQPSVAPLLVNDRETERERERERERARERERGSAYYVICCVVRLLGGAGRSAGDQNLHTTPDCLRGVQAVSVLTLGGGR